MWRILLVFATLAVCVASECYTISEDHYVLGPDNVERAYPSGMSKMMFQKVEENTQWNQAFYVYKSFVFGFFAGLAVAWLWVKYSP